MKNTTEKELDALMPVSLINSIHDGLRRYDGTRLSKPRPCPDCENTDYHKHDTRPRTFAVLITEDGFEEVTISVQCYWCKHCEKPVDSDMVELFYEAVSTGNPIVDLCLYHAAENPFDVVERILHTHYDIQVDRNTVQRYAELFAERVEDRHGVTVADETYPAKKGAKKELREENARRKVAWTDAEAVPRRLLRRQCLPLPAGLFCEPPVSEHRLRVAAGSHACRTTRRRRLLDCRR